MTICYCCSVRLTDKEIFDERNALEDKRCCKRCRISINDALEPEYDRFHNHPIQLSGSEECDDC